MPVQRGHNVEFKMDNMSEALIQESLDKSLSFLREQKASAVVLTEIDGVNANHPVQYNPQLKQWLRDETHPRQSYSRIVRTMSLEEYLRSMGHKE